jgi:uncharacterized protein YbcC (UPF0753/DUF2309 family)
MTGHSIDAILDSVRRYFPIQGPIKDFLHFNALAGFQNISFDKAVTLAGEFYGANAYMPLTYYRAAYKRGQISEMSLNRAVSRFARAHNAKNEIIFKALFDYVEVQDARVFNDLVHKQKLNEFQAAEVLTRIDTKSIKQGPHSFKIRQGCTEQLGVDFDAHINPILFRVVSGFLDQGITLWQFPTREVPFYEAVRGLVVQSKLPLAGFMRRSSSLAWLERSPDEVIEELLSRIVGDSRHYESYVKDTLMAHMGWSGMVNYLESRPKFLTRQRQISLKHFLAFKLILEWEFIGAQGIEFVPLASFVRMSENQQERQAHAKRELSFAFLSLQNPELGDEVIFDTSSLCQIWHEALEMTGYRELLSAISVHDGHRKNAERPKPSVQAIFCLDDRECSFRRYFEEIDPAIETFGWPGFFGIDFLFQSLNDASLIQQCPPVLTPKHVIREVVGKGQETEFLKQKAQTQKTAVSFELWREASSSLFLGFLAASTLGHLSIFTMFMGLFKPQQLMKSLKSRRIDVPTELALIRPEEEVAEGGRWNGFTHLEMANRVEDVLRGMGLTRGFAPLIVALAHGASSVNNPHFAAYDCAACSGKSGAPNARALAIIANMPEVRMLLAERGITIPADTLFLGGFHDTTTDFVDYFDLEQLSLAQRERANAFIQKADLARARNAQERCRRFANTSLEITESQALLEVSKRALALFEPRAELGHATCYSCVIGRRDLTRGLFLDRRAFLNSYNPLSDSSGKLLTQILCAAIPVCGNANLDYYFSRIDPSKYGCGTKLSHNVVGLLGVCNGVDDDLRTGLPVQMTELHDPIRLLLVIEQEPDIIKAVLNANPGLLEWVANQWVRIASVDPTTGLMTMCTPELLFEPVEALATKIPVFDSSKGCYQGSRENLPMASIATA